MSGFRRLAVPERDGEKIEKMIKARQFEQTTRSMSLNEVKRCSVHRRSEEAQGPCQAVQVQRGRASGQEKAAELPSLHDLTKVMDGTFPELNRVRSLLPPQLRLRLVALASRLSASCSLRSEWAWGRIPSSPSTFRCPRRS